MKTNKPNPLVIFDCDGVLVDSEPLSIAELKRLLGDYGVFLSTQEIERRFQGRSLKSTLEDLHQEMGLVVKQHDIDTMNQRLFRRFLMDLTHVKGVEPFLQALNSQELKREICVASSSHPERIKHSLSVVDLYDQFQGHIYSSNMVERGKPEPDLFLLACHSMGYQPENAIVIEDSPYGIQAAKKAGMLAIGLTAGSHAQEAGYRQKLLDAGSDHVFCSYSELTKFFHDQPNTSAY